MSDIHFFTTPNSYLPHYSYIFRNMDPLGTDIRNVACSMLGTMFYLEIQKWKEVTKTSTF